MSTVVTQVDLGRRNAVTQFATTVAPKPTSVERVADGWQVKVDGLGAGNLTAALDGFTYDPDFEPDNPPRPAAPTMVPGPDGQMYALTVAMVDGKMTPVLNPVE